MKSDDIGDHLYTYKQCPITSQTFGTLEQLASVGWVRQVGNMVVLTEYGAQMMKLWPHRMGFGNYEYANDPIHNPDESQCTKIIYHGDHVEGDKNTFHDNARHIVVKGDYIENQHHNSRRTTTSKSLTDEDVEAICEAWYSKTYATKQQVADALGHSYEDVVKAIDRDRKRE